jgi:catechol 2,3-dioxygenase-like lactoylglutathione lyase family enzyme
MLQLDHVQLAIPAGSEPDCRAFWCDVVGLEEIAKPAALAGRGGLWLALTGAELHLGVDRHFAPAKKAHPGFRVPDVEALAERLEKAGAPVIWDEAIAGRRRFFTEDPVGNRIEFLEG